MFDLVAIGLYYKKKKESNGCYCWPGGDSVNCLKWFSTVIVSCCTLSLFMRSLFAFLPWESLGRFKC